MVNFVFQINQTITYIRFTIKLNWNAIGIIAYQLKQTIFFLQTAVGTIVRIWDRHGHLTKVFMLMLGWGYHDN